MNEVIKQKLALSLEAINLYRSIVLDAVEMEVGDSPTWPDLRARLLRAFGDKGLSRRITEIFTKPDQAKDGA